ncbi:MAG: arylsulfatase [Phaeodactylibacter sp.]|nr:arylsulfatase [Phaeodactylibacter sp.]MCB9263498.1 arylsulfatase [Lewinellaceae bacterium]MCB9287624.1 arylsulfatase [Lewinellaceae bacterium]
MKIFSAFFVVLLASLPGSAQTSEATSLPTGNKPNIVYILADDLGYGELGAYGQELIETPNIDALAREGMRFTQHYSGAPVCAPARCVLMTGLHTGHAHIRGNDEWKERGAVWDYQAMFENSFLEGQRPLPDSVITIAELLKGAGYATGAVGKWGLGAPTTEGVPNRQGFDFFFGYNCQRQAHTYYPMHLWKNEERVLLDNKPVAPHSNLPEGADPHDPASYADFRLTDYAPALMHREALRFMEENREGPFFLYYASPIPHLPLQAPQEWVEYYQKKLGPEEPYTGKSYFPNRTPSATYAAMISYLDQQVGELVAKLKELGAYDNTLIIFSSDNGPTYVDCVDAERFNSAGPFREGYGFTKGFVYEGGIRVPMIASWPGHIQAGATSGHLSAFYDVMPTLCEVANVPPPPQIDGVSFLPTLLGQEQREQHDFLYWEFPEYNGQQAVRMGSWKGIRKNIRDSHTEIELYNLETDVQEETDLAADYPEIVERIRDIMDRAHQPAALERFRMEALGDQQGKKD